MKTLTPKFKTIQSILIIFTLGLIIASCNPSTKSTSLTPTDTDTLDTIPYSRFLKWNKSWETHWNTDSIVYFTMPLSDLKNTLEEIGVDSARFYLGFSDGQNRAHLTLVGVDSTGNNMIGGGNHIYDVSMPCPPGCGNGVSGTQNK